MSIIDSVARTVLQVKVDGVSEAKAQLSSLSAHEKQLTDGRIKGIESTNAGLEKWIGTLGQVGVAIGVAKVGMEAFEFHAHKMDLESAAAGVSIEKLRKASMGLKTDMELLEHAAKLNTGTFKLTSDQMAVAEQAMYVLEEQGKSSSEVWSAMEAALTKGSIKPLQSLGIVINDTGHLFDENGDKLDSYAKRQEALKLIMDELAKTADRAKGAQLDETDAMQKSIVTLRNYWDEAKNKLGELVTQLGPLLDALGKAVADVSKLVALVPKNMQGGGLEGLNAVGGFSGGFGGVGDWIQEQIGQTSQNAYAQRTANQLKYHQAVAGFMDAAKPDTFATTLGGSKVDEIAFLNSANAFNKFVDDYKKAHKEPTEAELKQLALLAAQQSALEILRGAQVENIRNQGGKGLGLVTGSQADSAYRDKYGAEIGLQSIIDQNNTERNGALTADWFDRLNKQQAKKQSFLENTFGPIDDFNAYAQAFQMLSGAVTAGLDAWIDGSISAGEALKKFLGEALKGLATHMAIEALKHGAYAIGSAAFGDVPGALSHAAAAAAFTAGAAAAAVAAKEFGGGASVPKASTSSGGSSTGGRGGSGSGNGGSGNQQPVQNIFVVGEHFSNLSNRERAREAERTVKLALGSTAGQDS